MAAGDPYVACSNPSVGTMELLWAISTKTAAGSPGIRVYNQSIAHGTLESTIQCAMPLGSFEDWLRRHIVLDANGDPALHLITST